VANDLILIVEDNRKNLKLVRRTHGLSAIALADRISRKGKAMMTWLPRFAVAVVIALSGGLALQASADAPPQTRRMSVNGVELSYIEQGTGAPVVFVHGAWIDLRFWEPQRQVIARQHRFIAYNQRYHGTAPWPDDGKQYSAATHAADLTAFIRKLNVGPVHLVGISYGGFLTALVASDHPELVRSLTLAEPVIGALLADLPEAKPALDDRDKALASIVAAVKAEDSAQAVKLFFDWVNNQGAGAFDKQPQSLRQLILDNARTVPLFVSAPRPPAISCTTLGNVKTPTLVVGGEQSRRYYSLINEVVVRCIPGSRLVIIPMATHPLSHQNPAAFNEALLQFLAQR
jgi:pimeloyl-ACP methyl ester carboxylesterase